MMYGNVISRRSGEAKSRWPGAGETRVRVSTF